MKPVALVLSILFALTCACTPETDPRADRPAPNAPSPSPSPTLNARDAARIEIYAEVIRRLVLKDHTFGGGKSPFDSVYVVSGAVRKAENPRRGGLFGPAAHPFSTDVVEELEEELRDLPPVRFIGDGERLLGGRQGVKGNGVIITLGPIDRDNKGVQVGTGLYCGGLCGQWLTYVLRERDDRWRITGTTGPYIIS
jgi:hypothetical protein